MKDLADALGNPWMILPLIFQVWMLVDAIRRQEWLWVVFMFFFPVLNAILYYFLVYRQAAPAGPAFELPGSGRRARMKELEGRIHHLDKARDHLELADLLFAQGKLDRAEASYRAAIERDAADPDAHAHLGRCLLQLRRYADALAPLERVCGAEPDHEYGETMMSLAEVYAALGRLNDAIGSWRRVLDRHAYARARVRLAEMLERSDGGAEARALVNEVVEDDAHAPRFQRKRDREWVARARALLRRLGA